MPHRPEGQGSSSSLSPGVVNSSVYTPPRVAGSAAAAIMRQQTSDSQLKQLSGTSPPAALQYSGHASGIVTPVVKSKGGLQWLATSNKSSDSTDRSTATAATTEDARSIATLATEDEREATASALLMVAKAAEREHQQHYLKGMVVDSSRPGDGRRGVMSTLSSSVSRGSPSTVPLKKRKKQLRDDACHVSPSSHSSNDRESTTTSTTGTHAHSYDSKDMGPPVLTTPKGETTKELLDSAKVHSTAQIGAGAALPIAQVLIPHFPTVLHHVLADKDLATNEQEPAIQWLPDGESWKVNNWNAMRRNVLPKYFSDLRDEHGSACGTIDAFLYHIDAWGFEEIKKGTNAGAYRHNLFIRGAQKLCVKMRPTTDLRTEEDNSSKAPNTVSPGRGSGETERMMLQVPMLASAANADAKIQQAMHAGKRARYDSDTRVQAGHGALHWPFSPDSAAAVLWGQNAQYNELSQARVYGMRAAAALSAGNPYSTQNGSYTMDPRLLCRVPTSDSINMPRQQQQPQQSFTYTPPQVRSGRGALRGIAVQQNRAGSAPSPSTIPSFRHGFPVSNRGKGRRNKAANRAPLAADASTDGKNPPSQEVPTATNTKPQLPLGMVSIAEAQRIGTSVQGVAVAISRKTKRKLPMAASSRKPFDKMSADGSQP
mmetsp:Transcript_8408/g.20777  ORF Transcript_8408/g.20777 Transcript_8408/m.20777 type:complete len:656 (+) Transcript_8408:185-2152(+)